MNLRFPAVFSILLISFSCADDPKEEPLADIEVTFGSVTTSVQLTEVNLSVTLQKNRGTIDELGFLFGESVGLTLAVSQRLEAPSETQFTVTKSGLNAGKQYFARPYAIVEGEEFVGDEFSFTTVAPSYSSMTPLVAGRGQRITIQGDFKTSNSNLLSLTVGGATPTVLSFTTTTITFLVPETVTVGAPADVSLSIAAHDLNVTENITVSRWSTLAKIPSPNFFHGLISANSNYNFLKSKLAYHFSTTRAFVYDMATDSWTQDNTLATAELHPISDPAFFQIGDIGYAGFNVDKEVHKFDLATKQWSLVGTFPGDVHVAWYSVFASHGTKAYYGLGYKEVTGGAWEPRIDFWEFNSANGSWIQRKDYPGTPIGYGVSFSINEYVFVGAGTNGPSTPQAAFFAYHTSDNSWTQVANYPGPFTAYMKAFSLGSKGFVIVKDEIWVYDFGKNEWSLYPDRIPGGNRINPSVFVGPNFFMIGGGITTDFSDEFYKLYPY
jgi:hypothetical protein